MNNALLEVLAPPSADPLAQTDWGMSAWVGGLVRYEEALARAQCAQGVVTSAAVQALGDQAAGVVAALLAEAGLTDLRHAAHAAGTLVVPVVAALKAAVGPQHAAQVHLHSTSQDALDTAAAVLASKSAQRLGACASEAAHRLAALAQTHRATPLLARTLMQPASVTSLGWVLCNWALPLLRHATALKHLGASAFAVQWGGAAGQGAPNADQARRVAEGVAQELGLASAPLPWQQERSRWLQAVQMAGHVGLATAQVARHMALHMQFEVGELAEPAAPGKGVSSAMAHKRNPSSCMSMVARGNRLAASCAALTATSVQHEFQRSLGAWQTELVAVAEVFMLSEAITQEMCAVLRGGLAVDAPRMARNIDAVRAQEPSAWFDTALAEQAAVLCDAALAEIEQLRKALN